MNEIFYKIFDNLPRQGPGNVKATQKAFASTNLGPKEIQILDIGCGTGAQTITLAKEINGKIIATDNYQPYLELLTSKSKKEKVSDKIICKNMDMGKLDFKQDQFDLIWAEGSIYIISFRKGLHAVKPTLKSKGYAVFSDMNWFKENPPTELKQFFDNECPDMVSVEENIILIKECGYEIIDTFQLEESGFWDSYYTPLENRLVLMRNKYRDNEEAKAIIEDVQFEIDLYRKYSQYYGYTFYIMQNIK